MVHMQLPFLLLSILNFVTAGHYFLSEINQDNLKETTGFFSFPHLFLASEYNFLRRLIFFTLLVGVFSLSSRNPSLCHSPKGDYSFHSSPSRAGHANPFSVLVNPGCGWLLGLPHFTPFFQGNPHNKDLGFLS